MTAPANTLPPTAPEKPAAKPELHPEVRRRLTKIFGTRSEQLALLWTSQIMNAMPGSNDDSLAESMASVWPVIEGIAPQDEIEAMLALQMVAVHNVALDQLHRAAHSSDYQVTGPAASASTPPASPPLWSD